MKLLVTDPAHVVVERDDIASVRAEDASGGFGLLHGHADLLTVLESSVLGWRAQDGTQGWCAVDGGILTMRGGDSVQVATREAWPGDDLDTLHARVLASRRERDEAEKSSRTASARMRTQAIRRIVEALRAGGGDGLAEMPR